MDVILKVNGCEHRVNLDRRMVLLDVLREKLGFTAGAMPAARMRSANPMGPHPVQRRLPLQPERERTRLPRRPASLAC
jgi:hypothetical protein